MASDDKIVAFPLVTAEAAPDDGDEEDFDSSVAIAMMPASAAAAAPLYDLVHPPFPLVRAPAGSTAWVSPPPHALGGQLALRTLRDALALQLARRGFDGLRQSALWLVTELAADFLQALGAQLKLEAGAPAPTLARRVCRQANMRRREEWIQAQRSFARVSEPPGSTVNHGGSRATGVEQRQVNPQLAPPAVAPLYAAMKGAWNYKASGAGRAAHSQAGTSADDWPTASAAPPILPGVTGRELSEVIRLSKKQRMHVEAWLQAANPGSAHTAPVLLPGAAIPDSGDGQPPAIGGGAAAAPKGRGRKTKAPAAAAAPPPQAPAMPQ